ncbi:TylF/MycF family methyltransferase [Streptomyces nogalater]|uniref:SnogL n=1 Tax=Streptomyces nogalater TaxID=38314 RepID=Q9EYI1_STRNO|nr:SnogL [Streptomyces nogalater]
MGNTPIELYLDLMSRTVSNTIYEDPQIDPRRYWELLRERDGDGTGPVMDGPGNWSAYDSEGREQGSVWPRDAHTMVGMRRLRNVRECAERVLADGVPGDFMETGVWRGGTCIFMRAVLAAYEVSDRVVWVADSFAGIPAPDLDRYPQDEEARGIESVNEVVGVPLETVRGNFDRYGLLDDQVRFLPGRFCDTLPEAPVERLALLRLDGDLYESTMDALVSMYPKLSPGGYLIVDDYHALDVCKKAVHDYRDQHGIDDPITDIDWSGAYWRKSA